MPTPRPPRKKYQRIEAAELIVRIVVRPEPDVELLACAIIDIAFDEAEKRTR